MMSMFSKLNEIETSTIVKVAVGVTAVAAAGYVGYRVVQHYRGVTGLEKALDKAEKTVTDTLDDVKEDVTVKAEKAKETVKETVKEKTTKENKDSK